MVVHAWAWAPPLTCLWHRLQRLLQLGDQDAIGELGRGTKNREGVRQRHRQSHKKDIRATWGGTGISPGAEAEAIHQELGQVLQDGLAVQTDELLTAYLQRDVRKLLLAGKWGARWVPRSDKVWAPRLGNH